MSKKKPKEKFFDLVIKKLNRKSLPKNILNDNLSFEKTIIYFDHIFCGEFKLYWGLDSFIKSVNDDTPRHRVEYIKRVSKYRNAIKARVFGDSKNGIEKDRVCLVEKMDILEYIMRHVLMGLNGSPMYDEDFVFNLKYMSSREYKDIEDYYYRMSNTHK